MYVYPNADPCCTAAVLSSPESRRRVLRLSYLGQGAVLKEYALTDGRRTSDFLREVP